MANAPTAKAKVLVIDDEPDVVTYLTTLLQDEGYATLSAADGEEGLAKAKSDPPDLITLDISMPEKSGVKFYREVCGDPVLGKVPVIVVTGVSEDFRQFISGRKQVPPPAGYLQKPIEREEFLKLVEQLLAGRQSP
jgi:CheY-like chemotaxis protein